MWGWCKKNDVRTVTTYPGNTVHTDTPDKSGHPEKIKATSPKGTLVDLAYIYTRQDGEDGGKIRTTTDAAAGTRTSYEYDSAGRFSYAAENKGSTLNASWQYCYDLAGNLTSQGVDKGCPRGTTYTVNDAQQITAKDGSTANWSYDQIGNETAAATTPETTRTGIKWTDRSPNASSSVTRSSTTGRWASPPPQRPEWTPDSTANPGAR
ncbi:YD repeat-containing protein [Streptomyces sp. ScaeMP-e83]|nr:YD repeat-containing protein [Streptomyces sp. ScaeMP-e83]